MKHPNINSRCKFFKKLVKKTGSKHIRPKTQKNKNQKKTLKIDGDGDGHGDGDGNGGDNGEERPGGVSIYTNSRSTAQAAVMLFHKNIFVLISGSWSSATTVILGMRVKVRSFRKFASSQIRGKSERIGAIRGAFQDRY